MNVEKGRFDELVKVLMNPKAHKDKERFEACVALGELGNKRAVNVLIRTLDKDKNKDVRVTAAVALGKIGGDRAIDALTRRMSPAVEKEWEVRREACFWLSMLGGERAVKALITKLLPTQEKHPWVRAEACSGLGRLKKKSAVMPLTMALRDEDPFVRNLASRALKALPDSAEKKRALELYAAARAGSRGNARSVAQHVERYLAMSRERPLKIKPVKKKEGRVKIARR